LTAPYSSDGENGTKALIMLIRHPGQRWHKLVCFGRKGHYYEDGGCEHTDAIFAERLTPRGLEVTKLDPFGGKPEENRPKRFAKRPPQTRAGSKGGVG
jgi:hypothetical protein